MKSEFDSNAAAGESANGLSLVHLFKMQTELTSSLDGGDGPLGRRILISVVRGTFAGYKMRGELVSGSGDWMLIRHDGVMVVDARVILKTEENAIIHMSYGGRIVIPSELLGDFGDKQQWAQIDPRQYYFRTSSVFETGSPDYAWLNNVVGVGTGRLTETGVAYDIFQVL